MTVTVVVVTVVIIMFLSQPIISSVVVVVVLPSALILFSIKQSQEAAHCEGSPDGLTTHTGRMAAHLEDIIIFITPDLVNIITPFLIIVVIVGQDQRVC